MYSQHTFRPRASAAVHGTARPVVPRRRPAHAAARPQAFGGGGSTATDALEWQRQQRLEDAASSSGDGLEAPGFSTNLPFTRDIGYPYQPFLPPKCPEKVIVVLRHGSSTWNEQVSTYSAVHAQQSRPCADACSTA